MDFIDVEKILFANGGDKEGQIQHEIGQCGGMQCVLCNNPRILLEAIQTIQSSTPSIQKSCNYIWKLVQVEGTSKDVSSSREFSRVCRRGWVHTTSSANMAEGRQLYNAVDFIIHKHHDSTKVDVFHFVNEEVKKMVGKEPLSIASFHKMWRTEFLHVQIPPFSRFSKCYHC